MRPLLPLLSLLVLGSAASAAESLSAVQLKVGQVPGADTSKVEAQDLLGGGLVSGESSLDPQTGLGVSLGLRAANLNDSGFGLSYEGNLFYRQHEGKDTTGTAELTAYGVELGLDLAYAPVNDLLILAGPRVGLGVGNQSTAPEAGLQATLDDGMGYYLSYGLQAELSYTVADHLMVGGYVGWMGFTATAGRDLNPASGASGSMDSTLSGSGATYGAMVGYQF